MLRISCGWFEKVVASGGDRGARLPALRDSDSSFLEVLVGVIGRKYIGFNIALGMGNAIMDNALVGTGICFSGFNRVFTGNLDHRGPGRSLVRAFSLCTRSPSISSFIRLSGTEVRRAFGSRPVPPSGRTKIL